MSTYASRTTAAIACAAALTAAAHSGSPVAGQSPAQPFVYRRADLTLVDTIGGAATGVAVDDATGIAYLSRGARVEALDVASDPAGPKLLATSERLAGIARVLGAAGGRAFVAVRNTAGDGTTMEALMVLSTAAVPGAGGGLATLPVVGGIAVSAKVPHGTGAPVRVERAFAADASTAYLVASDSPRTVRVIDLRAWPSTSEADVALGADVNGLAVAAAGATLLVATGGKFGESGGGLVALDVRNPAKPTVAGELALHGGANGVAVTGTTAYATTMDGLAVVDAGDPAHLALREPLIARCASWRRASLAVAGNMVWIVEWSDAPFPTRNVHSCVPSRSDGVGSATIGANDVRALASAGAAVLIAERRVGLLSITRSAPRDGSVLTGWRLPALGAVGGLDATGGVLRAMDSDSELWTFDMANAAAPATLGRSDLWPPEAGRYEDLAAGLAVRGDAAFGVFTSGRSFGGSVAAIALSPLDQPRVLGQWRPGDAGSGGRDEPNYAPLGAYGPVLSGNTLFVTGESPALTALDVTDPTAPRWVGRVAAPDPGWDYGGGGLALDGGRAWLALYGHGVGLVDVSDPAAPRLVDRVALPGAARDVARVGGNVLVSSVEWWRPPGSDDLPPTDGRGNLFVLDAATHRIVAQLPSDVPGYRLVVDGARAFVYGEGQIEVVDVRDPAHPVAVGRVWTGAADGRDAQPMTVVGDTLWAGAGDLGIAIYRLAEGEPFSPPPPIRARAWLPYGGVVGRWDELRTYNHRSARTSKSAALP